MLNRCHTYSTDLINTSHEINAIKIFHCTQYKIIAH